MINPTSFVTSPLFYGRVAASWIVQKIVSSTILSPYLRDPTSPQEAIPALPVPLAEPHLNDGPIYNPETHLEASVEPSPPPYEPDPSLLCSRREVEDLLMFLRAQDSLIGSYRHTLANFQIKQSIMKKEIKRLKALNLSLQPPPQRPPSPRADHTDVLLSGIEGAELPAPPRLRHRTRPPLTRAT